MLLGILTVTLGLATRSISTHLMVASGAIDQQNGSFFRRHGVSKAGSEHVRKVPNVPKKVKKSFGTDLVPEKITFEILLFFSA